MATAKNTFSWEDPFHLSAQLTDDERQVQEAARAYCQEKLLPRVQMAFRNETTDASSCWMFSDKGGWEMDSRCAARPKCSSSASTRK